MANSPQARKRAKQADVRRNHNASLRSRARTYVKKTLAAIAAGEAQADLDAGQNLPLSRFCAAFDRNFDADGL